MRRLSTISTSPTRPRRKSLLSLQPSTKQQNKQPVTYQTNPPATPYLCPLCHTTPSPTTPSLLLPTAPPQRICKPCYTATLQPRFLRALEHEEAWPVYLDGKDDEEKEGSRARSRSKSRSRRRKRRASSALDPTQLPDFPSGFAERWRRRELECATPRGERVYCRHWVEAEGHAEGRETRREDEGERDESAVFASDSEESLSPPPRSRGGGGGPSPRSPSNPAAASATAASASPLYRPPSTRIRTRTSIPETLPHSSNLVRCGTFLSPAHAAPQIDTRTFVQKACGVSPSGATRLVCGTCGGESCARCGMALSQGRWGHECVPGNLRKGSFSSAGGDGRRASMSKVQGQVGAGGGEKTEDQSEKDGEVDRKGKPSAAAAKIALVRSMTAPIVAEERIRATAAVGWQEKEEEGGREDYLWGWG